MVPVRPLDTLPKNWPRFVQETADALEIVYGSGFREAYAASITPSLNALLGAQRILGWCAGDDASAAGLCLGSIRETAGVVHWLHVIEPEREHGLEASLVTAALTTLREHACTSVLVDAVPSYPLNINAPLATLGFERRSRELMIAECRHVAATQCAFRQIPNRALRQGAELLVTTYRDHPGRPLHPEVHSNEAALGFLKLTKAGVHGSVFPDHVQAAWKDGALTGIAAGAAAGGDVAFLLHLAVAPNHQHNGIGSALLASFACAAMQAGFRRIALAVNGDNPARLLYQRLGFATAKTYNAYVWKQPERLARPGA